MHPRCVGSQRTKTYRPTDHIEPATGHLGYKGRQGIFELVLIDDMIRDLISRNASTDELRQATRNMGISTLREAGMRAMQMGLTTIEEVVRETVLEDEG